MATEGIKHIIFAQGSYGFAKREQIIRRGSNLSEIAQQNLFFAAVEASIKLKASLKQFEDNAIEVN